MSNACWARFISAAYQRRSRAFDSTYLPAAAELAQDLLRLGEEAEGWNLAQAVHERDDYDVEAFNLLISRWEKRVFNYLLRILQNREDALDLSQDVFLKAYQNLRKLDDPTRFAAWLFRIAHNEAYSLFRKRKPEGEPEGEERTGVQVTAGGTHVFPIELSLAVSTALERLSADQREAVVLKIYQGFKFEEMSEILSCPVSTVKSRLYTALELLKADLSPLKTRGAV